MVLSDDVTGLLLVITAAVTVVLLVIVIALLFRMGRLQRAYASALDPERKEDLFQSVQRLANDIVALRGDLATVDGNTQHLRELLRSTTSRTAVVRYDAFDDMGGALSFSAALLDETGDGVVVSAINGRSETRCYAKSIRGGTSEHSLTAEEQEAIAQANADTGSDKAITRRRRRAAT